uniref:ISXO2-like transposase domain-containing protein n=1 Tax=Chromera velia CCMP2878 TaxID=1169474 RepID=A0A0G4IFX7_9ALVE|eukprot:Cvel_14030.t1-p1 / transcript=Cvel_14030.t1 / gene=Cvel_14030 / organism=Chromera_velia_CCMP2878 / gene_product=hypothetical protein / transcript_product=hypothetical protein / location=Cvel_scaffold982:59848-60519(+) / protein_length=224 / sequence_SO=supercontig / SO=protein_coding / is_pseudo=false
MTKENGKKEGYRCNRKRCTGAKTSRLNGTMFSGSNLLYGTIVLLAYLFLLGVSFGGVVTASGTCIQTVAHWFRIFRRVIVEDMEVFGWSSLSPHSSYLIGGPGIIVEIDESKFGKRTHNRGHRVEGVWVVGGVERTKERRFFAVPVSDRNETTMREIIKKYVHPESILYTDMWKAYTKPGQECVAGHWTVNHKKWYVDPKTGVHTNTIEGTWNGMKLFIARKSV